MLECSCSTSSEFERERGIVLPAEYKQLAARYQGMTPTPSAFYVGHVQDAVCTLLTVHAEEGLGPYAIRDCLEVMRPYVPDGIYPFDRLTPGSGRRE